MTLEQSAQINLQQYGKIQRLKDEINRLNGEKGRPKILPNIPPIKTNNHKKKPQNRTKRSKKLVIKINRTEHIPSKKTFFQQMLSSKAIDT